jgi:4-hydroxybenzoate polyprenyltransferase
LNRIGNGAWLLGPLAICLSSILLVVHSTARPVTTAGAVLFVSGVMAAYSFDYWMDNPARRSVLLPAIAGLATLAGLTAAVWLPDWKIALALALGVVSLAYRKWKKWPLVKTVLVAGAWTTASLAFPIAWNAHELRSIPFNLALFATFASNALLCDLKDGAADSRAGVRSAVVLWGQPATTMLAAMLALIGAFAALAAHRPGLVCAGVALCLLSACPRWVSRPVLGPALVDCALLLPAVFILSGLA